MTIHYTQTEIKQICAASGFQFDAQGRLLLFVGHAHSGHSLIGALLDAHPDVCLANEVNVVKLVHEHQLSANQLEQVLYHAYRHNEAGWKNSAYLYNLKEGAAQGRSEQPVVLGDKKAGGSTRIFHNHPGVLQHIIDLYGERLRFVFVERNPVDIIAAYSHYMQQPPSEFHVNRYNENLKTVAWIRSQLGEGQWLTVKQDRFVRHPYDELSRVFRFLGVNTEGMESQLRQWVQVVRSDIPGKSASIPISADLQAGILRL